ncbi:MAG: YdcF family protein [Neisseriaceae bacterium]|nr:YdcF family protein [Neisseriaceae bacterium]
MLMPSTRTYSFQQRLFYFLLPLALWLGGHIAYVVYDGLSAPQAPADVAIVLGNADGSLSPRLAQRLATGLALYQRQQVSHIVVSGGLGKEGHYEGSRMRDYLLEHGVPAADISVDDLGNTTALSARNLQHHPRRAEFQSLIVVSQYFHLTRSKMLFRHHGFQHVQGAAPRYAEWRDLYALPREFAAFYAYLFQHFNPDAP